MTENREDAEPSEQHDRTADGASPPTAAVTPSLPADPAEYDSERNALARARGLTAPYIAGGRDPDPEPGMREERRLLRLLLLMVGAIIAGGFVLGIIANLMSATGGS